MSFSWKPFALQETSNGWTNVWLHVATSSTGLGISCGIWSGQDDVTAGNCVLIITPGDAGVMSCTGAKNHTGDSSVSPCKTKCLCPLHMTVAAATHEFLMHVVLFAMTADLSSLRGLFCIPFLAPLAL